jgi:hypothetical protein
MDGTAVRKVTSGIAAAVVLLGGLSACTAINPNPGASATPSATPSVTASPTPTPTTAATATATPSATGLGALSGAWMGTWTNETPAAVGTFTLTWAQQGTLLVGAIGVTGSNCISAGNVTGNLDGNKISFGAVEGTKTITYVGTVSGNTMTGTYSSECGPSKGTWSAVKR